MKATFNVQTPDRKMKPTIKHAFLEKMLVDLVDPPTELTAKNGSSYETVFDSIRLLDDRRLYICLCSFQQHILLDGSLKNIVVIRNWVEKTNLKAA